MPKNLFNKLIKRMFDIVTSLFGILLLSPLILVIILLIWVKDLKSPFYISERIGKNEKSFKIIKLRTMIVGADKKGVDSTASNDKRITPIGHIIRNYKLDELTQLFNVLRGDMSLVGPRPNVKRETEIYTSVEKQLLSVRPGITDFASIVFSDEGRILSDKADPDIAYNQLIRPGKSELGLFYINNRGFNIDLKIILATFISLISRDRALKLIVKYLSEFEANEDLIRLASRKYNLAPKPPPGATNIVTTRNSVSFD
jgi:lipopolysaccharide/colanic/teichoic acid biosynthesis glycosyltransferase